METGAVYPCFCCRGAAHPATGDFDRQWGVMYCEPCTRERNKWWMGQMLRGVAGDGHREKPFQTFYKAAETSILPGVTSGRGEGFTKFVRVPNPKPQSQMFKRAGRWKAGPDGVRKPQGPEPWRPFMWVKAERVAGAGRSS